MDPFTQRMLERAKARREKLDAQLSNAGHKVKPRRSPLKDANAHVFQASIKYVTESHKMPLRDQSPPAMLDHDDDIYRTPEKQRIDKNISSEEENGVQLAPQFRNKLDRLEKLYSDDTTGNLDSSNRQTQRNLNDNNTNNDNKHVKSDSGVRFNRLAALASTINNWEDDLSHPTLVKKGPSKAEKILAKMNGQVKSAAEPQPSTSGITGRWKSNMYDVKKSINNPIGFQWEKSAWKENSHDDAREKIIRPQSTRSPSCVKTPEKSLNSSGERYRFGGYSSPKNILHSPGSVLSKASLFESRSPAAKVRDPAEMSLAERMALFEKNKGEALIPQAPLTLSVPTKKLQRNQKSSSRLNDDPSKVSGTTGKTVVKTGRALFKQELENDILRDSQAERKKELDILRSRSAKNKEVAQAAAGSCIRPRQNSETNSSLKNSPVCPVKPTPAMDHIPSPPPLPKSPCYPTDSIERYNSTAKKQVATSSSSHSATYKAQSSQAFNNFKCNSVNLYPDLREFKSSETEYTVDTSESEIATLDSKTSTDSANDSTSFGTSILQVLSRQNKRQIETDFESSTSDISILDEMDDYLDECLANQEAHNHGPTPPKLNKARGSPAMTSSTKNTQHHSPINNSPLMHSVSLYRRQQSQPTKTPSRQITRQVQVSENQDNLRRVNHEAQLIQEKIKRLMDELGKQQTIISQASQALNLCAATVEFNGSREQVEGERLLLVATHRRQAALNEIQRLKREGTLRSTSFGTSEVQESGSLTISAITLPLKNHIRSGDSDVCRHFVVLIRHLENVIATPVIQANIGDSCVRFPSTLKFEDLSNDFKITIEIYSLETRAEVLPHEVKYHIHNEGQSRRGTVTKKSANKTPKKCLKQESPLIMPSADSPAGSAAVRSPAFVMHGQIIVNLKEVSRHQQFTLNKVPKNSILEGYLQMHASCELSVSVEHRGFLTMFEDVSGFGAWHRRWCLLKRDTLSYWKFPDDERKKTPIGSLELQGVISTHVGMVSRDICARPHTFLLETVRPAQSDEPDSLLVVRNGSFVTIKHLLSADTKEDRIEWCSKLNETLNLIRVWNGTSSGYSN